MNVNLKTELFIQNLYKLINSSELPVVNVYLVLGTVYENIKYIYNEQIQRELAKENEKKDQEQEEESDKESAATD